MALNDEISEKSITMAIRVSKITAAELKKILEKLIAQLEQGMNEAEKSIKTPEPKQGQQTLKQLSRHNDGLSTMELTDPNLRLLRREMKKNNIDFAAVRDGKGKYTLFFKGKDADSMTHAFQRYTQKTVKRVNGKPSINKTLTAAKAAAAALEAGRDKVKNRSKGALDI